jgi:hypothetical protein
MYPHRIRLRGPWECEPLERRPPSAEPLPPPRRLTPPCRWADAGLAGFSGRARLRRRFGYPGRIDAYERVWLTLAGVPDHTAVRLNGAAVGTCSASGACEFDVTSLLASRNELLLDVEGTADGDALLGEAALEVRCTAYLSGLRTWADAGDVHVAGRVVGEAERPLDLYVLLDRRTIAYAVVRAAPDGTPFHLTAPLPSMGEIGQMGQDRKASAVQVDLVNGATVWYTWAHEFARPAGSDPAAG